MRLCQLSPPPLRIAGKEVAGEEQVFSVKGLLIQLLDAPHHCVRSERGRSELVPGPSEGLIEFGLGRSELLDNSLGADGFKAIFQIIAIHYNFELELESV